MNCPSGYIQAVEGLAKICIPDPNLYRREDGLYEPSWAPVFYNPRMIENRDICVALLREELSRGGSTAIVDPLAATGVRGIRIALEAGVPRGTGIYMGDLSLDAVRIMELNVKLNNLGEDVVVVHADANELMYRLARREGVALGYIDVDPFGSPTPFINAAVDSVKRYGVVALTATDLAVLEGRYRSKLLRRYGVVGSKVLQSKDVAVRALLSFVARTAAVYDRYIEPLLSYVTSHYVRIYSRVSRGGTMASEILGKCLGALWCCINCSYHQMRPTEDSWSGSTHCPVCGERLKPVYPVWVCPISNRDYLGGVLKASSEMHWLRESSRVLLEGIYRASNSNTLTTRLTFVARAVKVNPPPVWRVVECLLQKGFAAARSFTYSDGVVTDAPVEDVVECVRSETPGCRTSGVE